MLQELLTAQFRVEGGERRFIPVLYNRDCEEVKRKDATESSPRTEYAGEKQGRSDSVGPVNTTLYEVNTEGCQASDSQIVAKLVSGSCFIITLNVCICIYKSSPIMSLNS